jgi:hypothetical protein
VNGSLNYHFNDYTFPAVAMPSWASQVERWSQLDAAAFGLPQIYSALRSKLPKRPDLVLLASASGSNQTDFDFAESYLKMGVGRPSKFVHTLPNSRSAALLQLMEWSGVLLCLQSDPTTLQSALETAMSFAETGTSLVWVFSITRLEPARYRSELYEIAAQSLGDIQWRTVPQGAPRVANRPVGDAALRECLRHSREVFALGCYEIGRSVE